ncbi:hypothetical protein M5E86_05060 [Blautia wexlerae]|nr:hypothetical protein M5E86_05060 [Blautia wexlerae]
MIIVDVIVPSIGRKYNFSLDEEMSVALLTEEIAEAICQKENCILDGEKEKIESMQYGIGKSPFAGFYTGTE